jgi:hypothetical protein
MRGVPDRRRVHEGAVCLLENFKAKVEDIDQYGGEPKIKFNFQ